MRYAVMMTLEQVREFLILSPEVIERGIRGEAGEENEINQLKNKLARIRKQHFDNHNKANGIKRKVDFFHKNNVPPIKGPIVEGVALSPRDVRACNSYRRLYIMRKREMKIMQLKEEVLRRERIRFKIQTSQIEIRLAGSRTRLEKFQWATRMLTQMRTSLLPIYGLDLVNEE